MCIQEGKEPKNVLSGFLREVFPQMNATNFRAAWMKLRRFWRSFALGGSLALEDFGMVMRSPVVAVEAVAASEHV